MAKGYWVVRVSVRDAECGFIIMKTRICHAWKAHAGSEREHGSSLIDTDRISVD